MHIVLDTNVLYAGIRSSRGAARVILELLVEGHLTAVLIPALLLEYEERLCGDATLHRLGLSDADVAAFLDELVARSIRVRVYWLYRPHIVPQEVVGLTQQALCCHLQANIPNNRRDGQGTLA